MNDDQFWDVISAVHTESRGDMDRKCDVLKQRLGALEDDELLDFIHHFDAADAAAYTWSLWGAAFLMMGGCSDDSFSDFRATLISQGREVFERTLNDPESLAEFDFGDEEDVCYEGFQYVKNDVAEAALGEVPQRAVRFPENPSGPEWDEDTVHQLYPKLSALYAESLCADEVLNQGEGAHV